MRDGWDAPLSREHTFSTGRVATLRASLPISDLIRSGSWDAEMAAAFDLAVDNQLDDPVMATRLNDSIVLAMFIDPPLTRETLANVEDSEMTEAIQAAFGGPAVAASFPDAADAAGSGDSSSIRGAAESDAGAAGGDGGGTGRRPASRSKRRPTSRASAA
jgi:hypothetical protein